MSHLPNPSSQTLDSQQPFTCLHVHTHFSSGGGPASPRDWCEHAAKLGYKALAIIDRGPCAGFPSFGEEAGRLGLLPIFGMEVDLLLPVGGKKTSHAVQPAVLLARDPDGMRNLMRVASLAFSDWPISQTPLRWEQIVAHAEGLLVVLPGADEALLPSAIVAASPKQQDQWGEAIRSNFGAAAFVGLPQSAHLAAQTLGVAKRMGVAPLALPVARYLHADDSMAYAALKLARKEAGWEMSVSLDHGMSGAGAREVISQHLPSPSEAVDFYREWPTAIENAARVAEMCAGVGGWRAEFQSDGGLKRGESPLAALARERLQARLQADELSAETEAWLDRELQGVLKSGNEGAWLALHHLVTEAQRQRIVMGAPLGPADGSLLAYALGISPLDPTPYSSPDRLQGPEPREFAPLPGIEVPSTRRDALLQALAREYGTDSIAHASCRLEITPKQAIRAAGLALGLADEAVGAMVTGTVERGWGAFTPQPEASPLDPISQSLANIAKLLRGAPVFFRPDSDVVLVAPGRSEGTGGFSGLAPLLWCSGNAGEAWVPWREEELCRGGYAALSVRASTSLEVLDLALSLADQYAVPGFQSGALDLSYGQVIEPDVKELFSQGAVADLPFVSPGATKGWEGALTAEGMSLIVARSAATSSPQGPQDIAAWAEQTAATGGTLVYRDQWVSIVEAAAGIRGGEVSLLRRAMLNGEADSEDWTRFRAGCIESGLEEKGARELWKALSAAAPGIISRYAASAWGRVAYLCARVKARHPAALIAAALYAAWQRGGPAIVQVPVEEANRQGIRIDRPDASRSSALPRLERNDLGWAVLWGLSLLPGWNRDVADRFVGARLTAGIKSVEELAKVAVDAGLDAIQCEALARAGACDLLGEHFTDREALIESLPGLLDWARKEKDEPREIDLFSISAPREAPVLAGILNPEPPILTPREKHYRREWERTTLGMAWTEAHEIEALQKAIRGSGDLQTRLFTTAQVDHSQAGRSIYLVGLLCGLRLVRVPGDETIAVASVEDLEGTIELVAFPGPYKRNAEHWTENNLVIVTARVSLHDDGEPYLLCEHLASYDGGVQEEELNLKFKTQKIKSVAVGNGNGPANGNDAGEKPTVTAGNGHSGYALNVVDSTEETGSGITIVEAPRATSSAHRLVLTLPLSLDDHADIDLMIALNNLLAAHPGSDTVVLRIPYSPETGAVTSAQLPRGVRYSGRLEEGVRGLLGPDALAVIKLS